jgi:hypothetical protein
VDIARSHGARVETREWLGFGKQKQLAVSLARNDWVLCLDVDERVSEPLAASIRAALAAAAITPGAWRGATASSAAGSRTARVIPTGRCASSIAPTPAGRTTKSTKRCSPPPRSAASTAT